MATYFNASVFDPIYKDYKMAFVFINGAFTVIWTIVKRMTYIRKEAACLPSH